MGSEGGSPCSQHEASRPEVGSGKPAQGPRRALKRSSGGDARSDDPEFQCGFPPLILPSWPRVRVCASLPRALSDFWIYTKF